MSMSPYQTSSRVSVVIYSRDTRNVIVFETYYLRILGENGSFGSKGRGRPHTSGRSSVGFLSMGISQTVGRYIVIII